VKVSNKVLKPYAIGFAVDVAEEAMMIVVKGVDFLVKVMKLELLVKRVGQDWRKLCDIGVLIFNCNPVESIETLISVVIKNVILITDL
jgi:hypothetical protein